jgi:large subunit ribosomal protein L9
MNMKVILNKDLATLGEEGDIKDVAKGYARNFLFPHKIAVPYTERTVKIFESRKGEIDARKEQKRKDAAGLKERLEAAELSVTMPAGANGKLYGAVTSQSVVDELAKQGFQIERKRVEIPGNSIKSVGKYKFTVKLYGNSQAELSITIIAQELKSAEKPASESKPRRRHSEGTPQEKAPDAPVADTTEAPASEAPAEPVPATEDGV